MKKLILTVVSFLTFSFAMAQAPGKMSYQAVIRNNINTLVTNQSVGIRISILQGSTSGSSVYVETQTPSSNANGLVSIEIGGGTIVSGNFSTIDWANGPYFVKTETDPSGGSNYTIMGTSQLLSVPYALYAEKSGTPGPKGDKGDQGIQGISGQKGDKGDTGAQGIQGVAGAKGDTGAQGLKGDKGEIGPAGIGSFTHYIGEEFGGGVIFHLYKDVQGIEHGLIVDKVDLGTSQVWSNISLPFIGSSGQSRWDGLSNSNAIVLQAGHTSSAAAICLNSINGGQSDWYLPSIQELNMLWNNYYAVSRALSQIMGAVHLQTSSYWSSTASDSSNAWSFDFVNGDASYGYYKSSAFHVRSVRAF